LKIISGKNMVKILEGKGWYLDHIRGSHYIMKKGNINFSITVPVHGNKDLKLGTQISIMKTANLNEKDL